MSLTHLHGATKLRQVHPIGKRAQLLFTQPRRRRILRTSPISDSQKKFEWTEMGRSALVNGAAR